MGRRQRAVPRPLIERHNLDHDLSNQAAVHCLATAEITNPCALRAKYRVSGAGRRSNRAWGNGGTQVNASRPWVAYSHHCLPSRPSRRVSASGPRRSRTYGRASHHRHPPRHRRGLTPPDLSASTGRSARFAPAAPPVERGPARCIKRKTTAGPTRVHPTNTGAAAQIRSHRQPQGKVIVIR